MLIVEGRALKRAILLSALAGCGHGDRPSPPAIAPTPIAPKAKVLLPPPPRVNLLHEAAQVHGLASLDALEGFFAEGTIERDAGELWTTHFRMWVHCDGRFRFWVSRAAGVEAERGVDGLGAWSWASHQGPKLRDGKTEAWCASLSDDYELVSPVVFRGQPVHRIYFAKLELAVFVAREAKHLVGWVRGNEEAEVVEFRPSKGELGPRTVIAQRGDTSIRYRFDRFAFTAPTDAELSAPIEVSRFRQMQTPVAEARRPQIQPLR